MRALFHSTSVTLLVCSAASVSGAAPIVLNETKQLFLDDLLISSTENVTRKIHAAQKHSANPLIWPTEGWEGNTALTHGSVIRDGDKYRMWYLSGPGVSYAESDDGIRWAKPPLGLFEIDGRKTNVVIRREPAPGEPNVLSHYYSVLGVCKDEREKDPSRRYKMGFLSIQRDYEGPHEDPFHHGQRRGLGVACSPDGFRWELIDSWATEAVCDGPGHWTFDPARQKYVLYGRTKFVPPEVGRMWAEDAWCKRNCWGRAVTRIESPDFINWDIIERRAGPVVLAPDVQDPVGTELYSMLVFPYESVYIGLVQVFHNQPDACYLDVQLAVSRDSIYFARVGDRSPFIPVGPVGSWDRFNNSIANNPPITADDQLRFYYSGRTYRHGPYDGPDKGKSGGGIGFAAIQRDRFVSLGASFDGGLIITKPVTLSGKTLHMNAKSDYGEIVVTVASQDGTPLAESKPVVCDSLDVPVEWETFSPEALESPVILRITLKNALLFALWCLP
jgi:hypothetical protein